MNKKEINKSTIKMMAMLIACAAMLLAAPVAKAQLSITNGDFENSPGADQIDVPDWFDFNNADGTSFWPNTWMSNGVNSLTGAGNCSVIFSGFAANDTALDGATLNGYLYQAIGTADGNTTFTLEFSWGNTNENGGPRTGGITVTVLEDTAGTFVPDDNTDVLGQAGLVVLDQVSKLMAFTAANTAGSTTTESWDLSLAGAGSGTIYLRFNNYEETPDVDQAWMAFDDVAITAQVPVELGAFELQ